MLKWKSIGALKLDNPSLSFQFQGFSKSVYGYLVCFFGQKMYHPFKNMGIGYRNIMLS